MAECNGNCSKCGGCAKTLLLSAGELHILDTLGQIPFLPIARKASDMVPIYMEDSQYSTAEYSLILQALEQKNLISLDYDKPLSGAQSAAYANYPVQGSMALTARGQLVLELIETQGIGDEL